VFHLPLFLVLRPWLTAWVRPLGAPGPLLVAFAMTALSFIAGLLSYALIERWFLELKRLFVPSSPADVSIAA